MAAHHHRFGRLQIGYEDKIAPAEYQKLIEAVVEAAAEMSETSAELRRHSGQISDRTLADLIRETFEVDATTVVNRNMIARSTETIGEAMRAGDISSPTILEELRSQSARLKEDLEKRQEFQLKVNQRIEALLAGDDAE